MTQDIQDNNKLNCYNILKQKLQPKQINCNDITQTLYNCYQCRLYFHYTSFPTKEGTVPTIEDHITNIGCDQYYPCVKCRPNILFNLIMESNPNSKECKCCKPIYLCHCKFLK